MDNIERELERECNKIVSPIDRAIRKDHSLCGPYPCSDCK